MAASKGQRSHQLPNEAIFVSTPGKVILHGEHAVVYGKTALVTSLNLRTFLWLTPTTDGKITLSLPDIDVNQTWELDNLRKTFQDLLGKDPKESRQPTNEQITRLKTVDGYRDEDGTKGMALIAFVYLYLSITGSKDLDGCNVLVISQLPTGAGLGSSAAFSVCLAASLLHKSATSLNLRTFLRLTPTTDGKITLSLPDIDVNQTWELDNLRKTFQDLLGKDPKESRQPTNEQITRLKTVDGYRDEDGTKGMALIAFVYLYLSITGSKDLDGCNVLVISQLPTGAGLGSSAAFSVCLAASLLHKSGVISKSDDESSMTKSDLDLINKWAFEGERLIHGNPSGIDNSVSVFGGALRFKNKPKVSITPLEQMPQLRILLINTKVPRSTKELVAGVRKKLDKYPTFINPVLDAIDNLSTTSEFVLKTMTSAPTGDEMFQLEELVDMNQSFLSILGVSHPSLQQVCLVTSQHGLHSKLTGAGGGGCAFTLLLSDTPAQSVEAICAKMKECGFEAWETCLGGVGVVVHRSQEEMVKELKVPEQILTT